jgi:hypothetical protein
MILPPLVPIFANVIAPPTTSPALYAVVLAGRVIVVAALKAKLLRT